MNPSPRSKLQGPKQMQPPSSFSSDTAIPETIGPFRIVRLLGAGGMGAVYLGERVEQFKQQVAIKILHPSLFPDVAAGRIEREGQMLTALDHAGIVRMLDLGVTGAGLRYIVMEYVDGAPLDAYCDRHRLPLRRRMEILTDVFEAVEDAHRHLVVHADLKPENILVTAEGKPRLLDFGVATMLSELGASTAPPRDGEDGSYTAVYASPEQRAGERLTVTSDIYSLGVIAQLVLTGLRPSPLPVGVLHSGATRPGTLKKLRDLDRNALASLAEARATTSRGLIAAVRGDVEAILDKALRIDAKERFQSVQEMREELWRVIYGYPIRTRPAGRLTRIYKWALRNRLAAALGCVLMFAVLFSVAGVVRQASEAARKRQIAQTRLHELVRLTDVLAGDLYESVHGLEGSEAAQAALLASAHQTVEKLAADDSGDTQLNLELAREYEKLAKLDLNRKPLTSQNAQQFDDDLKKEIAILNRIKASDPEARRIRERLPQRMQSAN